jgi:hypothetical protein
MIKNKITEWHSLPFCSRSRYLSIYSLPEKNILANLFIMFAEQSMHKILIKLRRDE